MTLSTSEVPSHSCRQHNPRVRLLTCVQHPLPVCSRQEALIIVIIISLGTIGAGEEHERIQRCQRRSVPRVLPVMRAMPAGGQDPVACIEQ